MPLNPKFNDERLVNDYLKGDEESLQILIKQYLKPIYNFIYQYVHNPAEAEDLAQEVFVRTWRNLKKFDQGKKFKTWLYRIAKNASIDFLRKRKAIPFSEFDNEQGENMISETLADPAPLPPEFFNRQNLAEELSLAMEKLPVKYRPVLILYYYEGFNFREIGQILGEPINTVKSRHRRALLLLNRLLTNPKTD